MLWRPHPNLLVFDCHSRLHASERGTLERGPSEEIELPRGEFPWCSTIGPIDRHFVGLGESQVEGKLNNKPGLPEPLVDFQVKAILKLL